MGDLWLVADYDKSKDDNKGTTAVFTHSTKGNLILQKFQYNLSKLELEKVCSLDAKKLVDLTKPSILYNEFWSFHKNHDLMCTPCQGHLVFYLDT